MGKKRAIATPTTKNASQLRASSCSSYGKEEVEQQLCAGGTTVAAEVQAVIRLDLF